MDQHLKKQIIARDSKSCKKCHTGLLDPEDYDKLPHVHHKDGDQSNNVESNLETLCSRCHRKAHIALRRDKRVEELAKFKPTSLSTKEFMTTLGVARTTMYRWLREHKISFTRLPSGRIRIPGEEVERIRILINGTAVNTQSK